MNSWTVQETLPNSDISKHSAERLDISDVTWNAMIFGPPDKIVTVALGGWFS